MQAQKFLIKMIYTKKILGAIIKVQLFLQVLVGLEYLHGLDIIHRNLRHSSVFIQPDGIVKVADFSLDLKIREFVSVTNEEILEDVYPLSLGRGGKKCDIYRK